MCMNKFDAKKIIFDNLHVFELSYVETVVHLYKFEMNRRIENLENRTFPSLILKRLNSYNILGITSVQASIANLLNEKKVRTSHLFLCLNAQLQGSRMRRVVRELAFCIYAEVTARLICAFVFLI